MIRTRRLEDEHVLAVARDAHHFEQRLGQVEGAKPFADGIFPWPVLRRHRLVDDRELPGRRVLAFVILGERPAANDRNPHRFEVVVTDVIHERGRRLRRARHRLAFDVDRAAADQVAHRGRERDRHLRDLGPGADAPLQVLVELVDPILVVADLFRIEPHRDEAVGVKAQIQALRGSESADEETGDDEQGQRAGDLTDDEETTETLAIDAVGMAFATVVERGPGIGA